MVLITLKFNFILTNAYENPLPRTIECKTNKNIYHARLKKLVICVNILVLIKYADPDAT